MRDLILLLVVVLASLSSQAIAHSGDKAPTLLDPDEVMKRMGFDPGRAEIVTEQVAEGLYVFFGVGGNVAVNIGDDGVLIVDDEFPQLTPKILSAIREIGGEAVDFAINTHWHLDHAGGNLSLGPGGTWLVAHKNSREMMKDDHVVNAVVLAYNQLAFPENAWPNITFSNDMSLHVNGQSIDLMHFGPAHTTGDIAVFFREANAVHLGDIFVTNGYPFIDTGNGGTLDGLIRFCRKTLEQINEDTIVIPGHGPVTDYQGFVDYVEMLETIHARLVALIDAGKSLSEVYAAKPTADYDEEMGDNTVFINRGYMSLSRKRLR